MRLGDTHLTYCLNVHPARDLTGVLANVQQHSTAVRDRVGGLGGGAAGPFGLGLWLPAPAVAEWRRDPAPLRDLLARERLYVFTLNGFPYGVFHGQEVKRKVYTPDWGDDRRLQYTLDLLELLAALLPPGVPGSISTVPVTYGKELPAGAVERLLTAGRAMLDLERRTGQHIRLALEPEPDCYLETTAEALAFFAQLRRVDAAAAAGLGVCFDTCHLCLQGEDLAASLDALAAAGICVPKVQVSAALRCDNRDGQAARAALTPYDELVYLHQTRVCTPAGERLRFPDLGPALAANPPGEWLVHFHVPLPFAGRGPLTATSDALTPPFFRRARAATPHLEIETYTFGVLPEPKPALVDSIAAEYRWVLARLG